MPIVPTLQRDKDQRAVSLAPACPSTIRIEAA